MCQGTIFLFNGGQPESSKKRTGRILGNRGIIPPFHFISCAEGNSGSRMRAGIVVDGKGQSRIWGDRIVIDWKEEAEKTYGFRVDVLRRGRGSWILETDLGLRLLKEYRGSVNRLEFEEAVLQSLDGMETVKADQYVRNSEGELLSSAEDGSRYIVKQWYADRECDLKDEKELLSAARALALLHRQFREVKRQAEWNMRSMVSPPLFEAMRRHNRELRRARTFIRGKRKKNEFELCVIRNFECFAVQAEEAEQGMERLYEKHGEEIMNGYAVCHGEPDYHHILIGNGYTAVTEFNQMHLGVQMEDLYYFLRKIMEKHDWNEPGWGGRSWSPTNGCCRSRKWSGRCFITCFYIRKSIGNRSIFYYNANKAGCPRRVRRRSESWRLSRRRGRALYRQLFKACKEKARRSELRIKSKRLAEPEDSVIRYGIKMWP